MEGARSLSSSAGGDRFLRQSSGEILSFLKQGNPSSFSQPPQNSQPRTVPALDPSEFPILGRSTSTSSHTSVGSSNSALPVSVASVVLGGNPQSQAQQQPGVFLNRGSITTPAEGLYSENFPALPQSQSRASINLTQGIPQQQSQLQSNQPLASNPFTQAVHQQQQQLSQSISSSNSSTRHDLTLAGEHGLLGLMGVIRMEDPDRGSLALGMDLTTLGLNLNSTESLHTIFSGPWDDLPRETLFYLPPSYPRKASIRLDIMEKLNLETLFVCFYSMPRDVQQVLAAQELVNRGWRFHEELKLWFSNPKSGSIVYFDVHTWEKKVHSGRLTDGFESGFLSPEIINQASRQALSQIQGKATAAPPNTNST